jgi:hypothetical protein
LDDFSRSAPGRSGDPLEQVLLAERAHFVDEGFKAAVACNRFCKRFGLHARKRDRDGLCLNLSGPSPSRWMVLTHASFTQPIQAANLFLAAFKARSQRCHFRVGNSCLFLSICLAFHSAYIYLQYVSNPTPFFAALSPLLFGKPRLTEIEKLLRQEGEGHSLSQYQESFGEFVPKALLGPSIHGLNSRQRLFPQLITFWAFLAQVLERGSSCRDALRRIIAWLQFESPGSPSPSTQTGGYCSARSRLPDATLEAIGDHMSDQLERNLPNDELWLKRRVKIVDGTTASMPDTEDNQQAWPQQRSQKPGCGFPLVKLVGFFSLGSGALLDLAEGHLRQHERLLARQLWSRLDAGDIVLADRGFCSYLDLNEIARVGADAVMRLHQMRKVDFRKGKRLGPDDQIVVWTKPLQRSPGYTPEAFAALPATLTLRVVRYRVKSPGFRTEEVVLVTTLLDPIAYPASELAALYFKRWTVELHFREIKVLLGLDVLRCLTPAMIRKEIAMHRIAYNLVRLLMQRASITHHVPLARISFKGALDSLHHFADAIHALAGHPRQQAALLEQLLQTIAKDLLPVRPGRSEPRAKKRRPKNYHLLTSPRRKMNVPGHRNRPAKIVQTAS